jgi:hypothetical protein
MPVYDEQQEFDAITMVITFPDGCVFQCHGEKMDKGWRLGFVKFNVGCPHGFTQAVEDLEFDEREGG